MTDLNKFGEDSAIYGKRDIALYRTQETFCPEAQNSRLPIVALLLLFSGLHDQPFSENMLYFAKIWEEIPAFFYFNFLREVNSKYPWLKYWVFSKFIDFFITLEVSKYLKKY